MPIPRKNPRTVISEEQKKLTEDTIAEISIQPGMESANSINSTNDTKDQNLRSDNDANGTNDRISQSTQSTIETSSTTFKKLQNRQSSKSKMSTKSQNAISTKDINTQSTEDREREVYYLTPSQVDKLDDLRIAYRKATGKRLNKQDFMRHIVDSLNLDMLV